MIPITLKSSIWLGKKQAFLGPWGSCRAGCVHRVSSRGAGGAGTPVGLGAAGLDARGTFPWVLAAQGASVEVPSPRVCIVPGPSRPRMDHESMYGLQPALGPP